jgi:putative redox protein
MTTQSASQPGFMFRATASSAGDGRAQLAMAGHAQLELAGDGSALNPIELLLGALASCTVLTFARMAAELGVTYDRLEVTTEGSVDPMAVAKGKGSPAVGDITLRVTIGGPGSVSAYEELAKVVDERCPVHATLAHGVNLSRTVTVA